MHYRGTVQTANLQHALLLLPQQRHANSHPVTPTMLASDTATLVRHRPPNQFPILMCCSILTRYWEIAVLASQRRNLPDLWLVNHSMLMLSETIC